ncbi:MAG: hypothetical protein AVDCRST_MAG59-1542 [uncultured Thermomicrobiales bacterium]|uniref:Transmembrane protein n=1 Tax=uncultured Thermomicrobiales bacterium TaxID=1645740 RepID=A0A6J4UG36_9BACT|nr:MAG: hypothetical protein AVDCRST_MAG59-1542 [uncultured Thermomicrobiales bacterium]
MDPATVGRRRLDQLMGIGPGVNWRRNLLAAATTGTVVFAVLGAIDDVMFRLMAAWTGGLIATLVATWTFILRSTPDEARAKARAADPGGAGILAVFVAASLSGLLGAIVVVARPETANSRFLNGFDLWLALVSVAAGWFVMQTAFALHYAQLYWGGAEPGGLSFPGEPPDDVDFAYFAFGVGMTFQVADVTTTSTSMRRTVLIHATLSFVYNSAILALTINLLAGRF